jgi:hypothetical protein
MFLLALLLLVAVHRLLRRFARLHASQS